MDHAVRRVKGLPLTPNVRGNKLVTYKCRFCKFKTRRLSRAWAHSETHGPWPEELGGSKGYLISRIQPYSGIRPLGRRSA